MTHSSKALAGKRTGSNLRKPLPRRPHSSPQAAHISIGPGERTLRNKSGATGNSFQGRANFAILKPLAFSKQMAEVLGIGRLACCLCHRILLSCCTLPRNFIFTCCAQKVLGQGGAVPLIRVDLTDPLASSQLAPHILLIGNQILDRASGKGLEVLSATRTS